MVFFMTVKKISSTLSYRQITSKLFTVYWFSCPRYDLAFTALLSKVKYDSLDRNCTMALKCKSKFSIFLCLGFHTMLPKSSETSSGILGLWQWLKIVWNYLWTPKFNPLKVGVNTSL